MLDVLTVVTGVAALLLGAWCGWAAYRDQPTKDWHFIGMAVVTLLALAQLVVGIVQLARGEKPEQGTTIFVAYLLGAFACVPAAGFMSSRHFEARAAWSCSFFGIKADELANPSAIEVRVSPMDANYLPAEKPLELDFKAVDGDAVIFRPVFEGDLVGHRFWVEIRGAPATNETTRYLVEFVDLGG